MQRVTVMVYLVIILAASVGSMGKYIGIFLFGNFFVWCTNCETPFQPKQPILCDGQQNLQRQTHMDF